MDSSLISTFLACLLNLFNGTRVKYQIMEHHLQVLITMLVALITITLFAMPTDSGHTAVCSRFTRAKCQ